MKRICPEISVTVRRVRGLRVCGVSPEEEKERLQWNGFAEEEEYHG